MAYDCICIAHEATDVLKSELGAVCSQFETEDEYLEGILKYVKEIEEDPEEYLKSWGILDETDIKSFKKRITFLRKHIERTITTPLKGRGKPRG
jgi:hypothetical protein